MGIISEQLIYIPSYFKSIPFITPFKIASCVFFPTYPCSMEHFTNGRLAVNSFSARKRIPSPGEIFPPRNSPSALTKSYVIAVPESITSNSRPGKRNAPPTQPAIRSTPKVFGVSYPKRIGKGISDDTSQKKVETSRSLSRTSAEIAPVLDKIKFTSFPLFGKSSPDHILPVIPIHTPPNRPRQKQRTWFVYFQYQQLDS